MKHLIFFLTFYSCFCLGQVANLSKLSYLELDSLMMVEFGNQNYEKAALYMLAGKEKSKAEFGRLDSLHSTYLMWSGYLLFFAERYKEAESIYIETKEVHEKIFGKEHQDYATNINNLGSLYWKLGQYKKAELLMVEAKNIQAKILGKEHMDYTLSVANLAQLYKETGDYSNAEKLYLEAKDIYAKVNGKESPEYAMIINNLANLYGNMGAYGMAEQLHKEANDIRRKTLGENSLDYAVGLNDLGTLYCETGDYESAEKLYMTFKSIVEKTVGKEHTEYALSLNNLATLYQDMGKFNEASELLQKSMEITKKNLGVEHPHYAIGLSNLARLYKEMGKYELAEPLILDVVKIREKVFSKKHSDYAEGLNHLVDLYIRMNNSAKAWNYAQQAITTCTNLSLSNSISAAWADSIANANYSDYLHLKNMISLLGCIYRLVEKDNGNSKKEKQIIIADLCSRLLKKSRDGFVSPEDKLRVLSQSHDWMLHSLNVLDLEKQKEKAFEAVELNKAALLLESRKTNQAYEWGDLPDALVQEEKKLFKDHAELEAKLLENRSNREMDSLRTEMNALNLNIKKFKEKIEKNYPKYSSLKYEQKSAQITGIQNLLPSKTALLEYVLGDSVLYIFYIDKQNTKILTQSLSILMFNTKIEQLHNALSNYDLISKNANEAYQLYTKDAHWFYKILVSPALSKNSTEIENLVIISDGQLGHLPFEAFLVEEAPQAVTDYSKLHYLVKDYNISYNYSATLFAESLSKKNTNNGQILAMAANYDIKLDSTKKHQRLTSYLSQRELLQSLPEARKEVSILGDKFHGQICLDKIAAEGFFKSKASDYAVIHLAMHGLLDNKSPILSSLVFTEDGDSLENNFLHAYEISKMKLNADLVVLSACETGYGRFDKGNGIASLAQAFSYAGAPAMIVSLWQVNDYATSEIMKNLYQNLADGMEKDDALRQAKIKYMNEATGLAAHPAFWSPFILMGNTNSIPLTTQFSATKWWILVGFFIALGIIIIVLRKRKAL